MKLWASFENFTVPRPRLVMKYTDPASWVEAALRWSINTRDPIDDTR
jgi:hypothetical protein